MTDMHLRVVNVIDLRRLQTVSAHPHELSDRDFDELFTTDKPLVFAFHGYLRLIHRMNHRHRHSYHANRHVRGNKEEGTITTAFDMPVRDERYRFQLSAYAIDPLPQSGEVTLSAKRLFKDKWAEHRCFVNLRGQRMSVIRDWRWHTP